jgi:hypothetical protein
VSDKELEHVGAFHQPQEFVPGARTEGLKVHYRVRIRRHHMDHLPGVEIAQRHLGPQDRQRTVESFDVQDLVDLRFAGRVRHELKARREHQPRLRPGDGPQDGRRLSAGQKFYDQPAGLFSPGSEFHRSRLQRVLAAHERFDAGRKASPSPEITLQSLPEFVRLSGSRRLLYSAASVFAGLAFSEALAAR